MPIDPEVYRVLLDELSKAKYSIIPDPFNGQLNAPTGRAKSMIYEAMLISEIEMREAQERCILEERELHEFSASHPEDVGHGGHGGESAGGKALYIDMNHFNPKTVIVSNWNTSNGITFNPPLYSSLEAKTVDFNDLYTSNLFQRSVTASDGNVYSISYNTMHCNEPFYIGNPFNQTVTYVPPLTGNHTNLPTPVYYNQVVYIANRSDGLYGTGTRSNPYNGTVYFDDVMSHLCGITVGGTGPSATTDVCIYLSAGTYTTIGGGNDPSTLSGKWYPLNNWTLSGEGTSTRIQFVSAVRSTYFNNLSGVGTLGMCGITSVYDPASGFCVSNLVLDGVTLNPTRRNISSLTWNRNSNNLIEITTSTSHLLTAGDIIAIGGVVWGNNTNPAVVKGSSGNSAWLVDRATTTLSFTARPYNFTIASGLTASYTYNPPQVAICNAVPLSIRNSGHNIFQNITAYGTGPIYENLGMVNLDVSSLNNTPTHVNQDNLITGCTIITVPFSGENVERYGTGLGLRCGNDGWYWNTNYSGSPCWMSAIVTNNLVLSSNQAYGVYGIMNTYFYNNTSIDCKQGWFTDSSSNVGVVINSNSFLRCKEYGMLIQPPIFRNGYIVNNLLTSNGASVGLYAHVGADNSANAYKRTFANSIFTNNTLSGFSSPFDVDATAASPGPMPLSALMTVTNNLTVYP